MDASGASRINYYSIIKRGGPWLANYTQPLLALIALPYSVCMLDEGATHLIKSKSPTCMKYTNPIR